MTANQALDVYLASLPDEERVPLVCKLREHLCVTEAIFSNWRRSKTKIKQIYRREIAKIIGKDIFADVTD